LIEVKAIGNIKAKAIYEEGLKKHGKLPAFLATCFSNGSISSASVSVF